MADILEIFILHSKCVKEKKINAGNILDLNIGTISVANIGVIEANVSLPCKCQYSINVRRRFANISLIVFAC